MFKYFPGLGGKGKDVRGLLENSLSLLGEDADVFKPVIFMTFIKSIRILAIFFALYNFSLSKEAGKGFLTVLAIILISPIISYLNMKYKAITSWIIYDILRGKDTDVSKGSRQLSGVGFTIFLYSLVDHIVNSAKSSNRHEKNGIVNMIKGLIFAIFQEVWDLVKNFSLPAVVVDKATLK
jgi:hypothetical protein